MCDYENECPEGWVKKKGFFGIWSTRYCVLQGSQLIVWKDNSKTSVDLTIEITPDSKIEILTSKKNKKFYVADHKGNSATFKTKESEQMMLWVLILRAVTFNNPSINMNSFDIISVIGKGCYGKVRLVKSKTTGEIFAIKSIRKSKLVQHKRIHTVIAERNILSKANHPFIVALRFAFQTPAKFYLGLEYVPGGELFAHMHREGRMTLKEIKMIIAQVAIALNYLHGIGIVYRDIKPENILIGADGYIKLADFGLAKDLIRDSNTMSFCGTPKYIAPETIIGVPYDQSVDWWSLGILTYELLYNRSPFYSQNVDVVYRMILNRDVVFPPGAPEVERDFISSLLAKDPKQRAGYNEVANHEFLSEFSFDDILNKRIEPDYIPLINDFTEVKYFDPVFTSETKADSYVPPIIGSNADVPGFSYVETVYDNGEVCCNNVVV